jgi:CheY-like chemotaxis protein
MNTEGEGSGPTAPAPEPSVLVVEGDVMIRLVVAAYLRECGFKVVEASSADEALTVLKTDRKIAIDVAFVDMDIAGSLDGFGLSQWIRRERAEIKIILASGSGTANSANAPRPVKLDTRCCAASAARSFTASDSRRAALGVSPSPSDTSSRFCSTAK